MIYKHLKNLRLQKKLTLEQMAAKMNRAYNHYCKIENNRVSPTDDTITDILVKGMDIPYSKARDMIATWRIEDALKNADDPYGVLRNMMNEYREKIDKVD